MSNFHIWSRGGYYLRNFLFIIFMVGAPLAVTYGPVYFLKPSEEIKKIDSLIAKATGEKIALPLSNFEKFGFNRGEGEAIEFRAVIERCVGENAIFIPYFDGNITIEFNGLSLILDEKQNENPSLLLRHFLMRLEAISECKLENLDISIGASNAIFLSLSNIYIGDYEKLLSYQKLASFFQNDLRIITFTTALILFLASIFLYVYSIADQRLIFMIGYVGYLAFGSSLVFFKVWPDILKLQPVFIALLPITTILIKLSGVLPQGVGNNFRLLIVDKIICFLVGIWIFIIIFLHPEHYYVQMVNTFFFVSVFVIYLSFLVLTSLRSFISPNDEINFWVPIALISFLASTINELFFRIGGIGTSYFLTHLAALFVALALASIFFENILRGSKRIAAHNDNLKLELKKNQEKLILEYELNMRLLDKQARNEEIEKFNEEIHDGLVTYLSMIVHLAHDEKTDQKFEIKRLAQTALDEARIILGIKNSEDENYFMALATLRIIFQNSFKERGIVAHWDILALLDHQCSRPEHVLDLVRIVQEALNNAIFRAKCRVIVVTVKELPNSELCIRIDNTGGSPYNTDSKRGMGIRNMKKRASKIGAKFEIAALPTGASVSLTFEATIQ